MSAPKEGSKQGYQESFVEIILRGQFCQEVWGVKIFMSFCDHPFTHGRACCMKTVSEKHTSLNLNGHDYFIVGQIGYE